MTAEIAILNKSAVALAADSKVTLSVRGSQKTYDTVDKLFSLSKTEPVGAMIYGNAEFVGFPWETIVKNFRKKNGSNTYATVFDWADSLQRYLLSFFSFKEEDEDSVALSIAQSWITDAVAQAFQSSRGPHEFPTALDAVLNECLSQLEGSELFVSDAEWAAIRARLDAPIGRICASGIMKSFDGEQEKLRPLAELGIRRSLPSPNATGLVVAGFGDQELLPSLIAFDVDGILCGRLKARQSEKHDMTRRSTGVVVPFAQTDMIDRFMEGIDPTHAVLLHSSVGQLILDSALKTAQLLGHTESEIGALMPALQTAAQDAAQTFWDMHDRQRRDMFAAPIIDMVMSLPKDELANVAESLVSLTSLQRRVSRELETVGGAIDVAVISKGDGFVWIKRKHYFEADRNLRFVNAYFHDQLALKKTGGSQ